MRDICISGEDFEIKKNRKTILEYCMSDVEIIVPLASAVSSAFQKEGFTKQKWLNCALKRGEYANASARMVRNGHPIDYVGLRSFQKNIPKILASAAKECNQSSTELVPFLFSKKDPLVVKKQVGLIKKWIEGQGYRNWPRTDKGHISLNRDAVSKFFNEDMPGFRGAIRRYASIEEAVKGFKKSKSKKSKDYFDFVGTDRRCRHKMGIYGSQTARSQHGATGFLPAKSRWMKICVVPEKGKAIVELDYSQQEFLIQAILSQDRKMIDAYASGDPYLTFAKTSGMAPISATKKSHKRERNIAKQLVLAVSYDMGPYSMAKKLTDSGIETSSQKAEELIERFYDVYNKYADWKWSIQDKYTRNKKLTLPDGWTLFGDQKNHRSVGNFPVQGMGSVILRESVKLAQAEGIKILYTMHDSITAEIDCYDFEKIETLKRCMIVGFANVMKGRGDFLDINIEGDRKSVV